MKAALVGYGYWGRIVESYIQSSSFFELEGIYNSQNIKEFSQNILIEAVFICTPVPTHFDLCKKFLIAGKHVFCEKVTVKKIEEFDILSDIAKKNGLVLYTDYTYIYSPGIRFIKNNLKEIGVIKYITGKISQFGRFYDQENVFEIIGVHMLSLLIFLTDSLKDISYIHTILKNNITLAGYIHANEVDIECSLVSPVKTRMVLIYGEKGIFKYDMLAQNNNVQLWLYEENDYNLSKPTSWTFDEKNSLKDSVAEFAASIRIPDNNASNLALSRIIINELY
jgi:predicted dehydrogenase